MFKNKPLRLSYSILSAWERGNYDDAIDMYQWRDRVVSPAMEKGLELHKQWEAEIKTTNSMPKVFGGAQLQRPQVEIKLERQLNDWLVLAGKLDVLTDDDVGRDWKSGAAPATSYTGGRQHCFYQVLAPRLKRFEYHAYNPYTNDVTMAIVHLTKNTLQDGLEYILTYASEFRHYAEENNILHGSDLGKTKTW